ncbi:hypothetical protein [Faecalibacter macacae]|uniref:Uncharacterized protein n=1 Tax=Faecalibacter macacae TaxID=1859289 RepID=A0A3L9M0G2_9FLAO|nr:hypothetical protein [Faecalibacter macacae]RLZ06412.1 hypothetical protein EAH69_13600 [Faecalibacter macacae]
MLFSIKKVLSALMIISLISFIIESPFKKGGITEISQYFILGIAFGLSLIYSIQKHNNEFSKIQKLVKFITIILSSGIGLVISLIISRNYLEKIYGLDFRLYINETFSNFSFFTIAFIISALLLEIFNKIIKSYNYS